MGRLTCYRWVRLGPQVQANSLDERSLRDGRYDGILHLVTAACGAEEYYTLENNEVRHESAEAARDVRSRALDSRFVLSVRACGILRVQL